MKVCFIGHRQIKITEDLRRRLRGLLLELIGEGTTEFLFGDHSQFDGLCYEIVTELRSEFPQLRRVKYRTHSPELSEYAKLFFLTGYEDSICPAGVAAAGRAAYVERNRAMIRDSDVCVFFYSATYAPWRRKESEGSTAGHRPPSGTALAYNYALQTGKRVENLYCTPAYFSRL